MREGDQQFFFFKFYHMSPALFDKLLGFVAADLTQQHFIREPLEPGERLAITLSYLASGLDICNVALAYRVGIETARRSIHVTCRAIWARLKDHFMKQTSGQGHVDPCYFPLQGSQSRNFSADAADARTLFSAYFCSSAGEVPWQWHQPGVSKQGALKRLEEQRLHPFC
ncbi:hypothetical protein HPB51_010604 [Rhipicephalus microplus]|uniref:Uncharacterized protein n=1 Tax=Rhipicephalus microplus TaxID=6941 RepID=A0A9J6EP19_RHIMP|nr:hypothetical protein HPB51_010604 [Rhipicephalus microplus]